MTTHINRHSRILSRAAGFMLSGFLLLVLFVMYGTLPNRWYHVLAVNGGSMQPEILPGDLIVITPCKETVQSGSIVTLSVDNELVTHRLVGFTEAGEFITQGDSNPNPDEWSPGTDVRVMGRYRLRIPLLGYLANLPMKLFHLNSTGSWFTDQEEIHFHLTSKDWNDPTPPPGQSGTSISADVTAEGFIDPAAEMARVAGQVCVTNGGEVPTEGLQIAGQVQYKAKGGGFQPLDVGFTMEPPQQLQPGETACYAYEVSFSPVQTNQYRLLAEVTITNHSGWMPGGKHCPGPEACRFGPEVKTSFSLTEETPDTENLISTELPPVEETQVSTAEETQPVQETEASLPTEAVETEQPGEQPTEQPTEAPTEQPTEPPAPDTPEPTDPPESTPEPAE